MWKTAEKENNVCMTWITASRCAGHVGRTSPSTGAVLTPPELLTPKPHSPAKGSLSHQFHNRNRKMTYAYRSMPMKKKYNLGNLQGKKIYYFNKSLDKERLPFCQRSKSYVRTMGSYLSPGLE